MGFPYFGGIESEHFPNNASGDGSSAGLSLGKPAVERWKVKKDGGDFDQFAGATITPRGVVGAVRHGLEFFAENKSKLIKAD